MAHDFFQSLEITASALAAERTRVAVITQNIANASDEADAPGADPYRRQAVVFESVLESKRRGEGLPEGGVRVARVVDDPRPFVHMHRPGHPGADEDGWVAKTNVELPMEMADLLSASRSYESNLVALRVFRKMYEQTLQITR